MSDRLDDTLRDLARADAPDDLSARVRVALETGSASATLWPKLAAATLFALLVTGGWFVMNRADGTSSSAGASAEAEIPPSNVGTDRTSVSPSSVRAGGTSLSAVASAKAEVPPSTSDHQHALASLAEPAAVGPAALTTVPMSVEATEIAPLATIAPLEIPALDAGEGGRR